MGRKGSKGFPGKNLYPVSGKPLSYYPINAARECKEIDRVYISTDDERLARLARENDTLVIKRPPELCKDESLGDDVYIHAYNYVKARNENSKIELVVLLMCNAATITTNTISRGIKILRDNPGYDSAVTVSKYNMWSPLRARKIGKNGLLEPFVPFETFGDPSTLNCDRDSQGDAWFADMGVSIVRPRCLEHIEGGLLPQKWMGKKIYPLKQSGGLDVDYEWQVPQVEHWLRDNRIRASRAGAKKTISAKPTLESLERTPRNQGERMGKLRLDKNENTVGIDKDVMKKILSDLSPELIASYPESGVLYRKLSDYLNLKEENLVITFGSDGAIRSVFAAFVNPGDEVVTLEPTYAMYDIYCSIFGARNIKVHFDDELRVSVEKLKSSISDRTSLVAIANPNSPTSTVISVEDMAEILDIASEKGAIVLADEAYHGFYSETMLPFIKRYKNLVVTRTFSKAAGLASLRIGYAAGDKSLIDPLYKVKPMYESSGPAVHFARYMLENPVFMDDYIARVKEGKDYLVGRLSKLGFRVLPSHTNFLVVKAPEINNRLAKELEAKGALIKGGYPHPSMRDTIRITAGPREQMARFMKVFESCLEDVKKK